MKEYKYKHNPNFTKTKKKRTVELEKIPYHKRKPKSWTLNMLKPGDQKGYWFYRNNSKIKDETICKGRTQYRRAVMSLHEAISELLLEYEGGVMSSSYGYFVPMVLPWIKGGIKNRFNVEPLFHTQGRFYSLVLFTDCARSGCLKGMQMDYAFTESLRSKFSKKLFETNYRPKLYYTTMFTTFSKESNKQMR